jgi:hypothetical protein|tara:strand:+ start:341 stop:562 length:222 start_codon:yes stop_codon:yes gene_type:complete
MESKYKSNQEISDCIILHIAKNRITKKYIEREMNLSYPTILKKIENPGTLQYDHLRFLCKVIQMDLIELITKY